MRYECASSTTQPVRNYRSHALSSQKIKFEGKKLMESEYGEEQRLVRHADFLSRKDYARCRESCSQMINYKETQGSTYNESQGCDSFGEGRVCEGIRVHRVWNSQQSLKASLSFPVPVFYFIIR